MLEKVFIAYYLTKSSEELLIMPVQKTPLEGLKSDLITLDSKINLLVQKIRTMEKNEEVIGRTLVSSVQKIKGLEEKADSESSGGSSHSADIQELKKEMQELSEDVRELKYVMDMINPLEYAKISQVREMIEDRLKELRK